MPEEAAAVQEAETPTGPAKYAPMGSASPAECIERHAEAQRLMKSGDLLSAEQQLKQCLHPGCSPLLRAECGSFLERVQLETPSVIFSAALDGGELHEVAVFEGERSLAQSLGGLPLSLNPGPHTFRFELEGQEPLTVSVVLRTGEKKRVIAAEFESPRPPQPPTVQASAPASPESTLPQRDAKPHPPQVVPAPDSSSSPASAFGWTADHTLLGFGLGFGVAGVVVGALARSEYDRAQHSCAPMCDESDYRSVFTKSVIADSLFVLSGLTMTYATIQLLGREEEEDQSASAWLKVSPGGLSAGGQF